LIFKKILFSDFFCRSFFCEDCVIRIDEERYTKDLKDKRKTKIGNFVNQNFFFRSNLVANSGDRRCAFCERVIRKNQDALFNHRVNLYK